MRILYLCNAFDERTRTERGVSTDSPAASRKVFETCSALHDFGISVAVLSFGRGRTAGSGIWHSMVKRRVGSVPVFYMPFLDTRILSEIVSLCAPLCIVWGLRRKAKQTALLAYNRHPANILAVVLGWFLGFRVLLDLEDDEIPRHEKPYSRALGLLYARVFDLFCKSGALIACNALGETTKCSPRMVHYGVTNSIQFPTVPIESAPVRILFSGTLMPDTGADNFAAAVSRIRGENWVGAQAIELHVCGFGPSVETILALSLEKAFPLLVWHGRLDTVEYSTLLKSCHIGLSLKPPGGHLDKTTFPSKVVEYCSAGLLVLSTDVSDVRRVIGDDAIYLDQPSPDHLAAAMLKLVENRHEIHVRALNSQRHLASLCSPLIVADRLTRFIWPGDGDNL